MTDTKLNGLGSLNLAGSIETDLSDQLTVGAEYDYNECEQTPTEVYARWSGDGADGKVGLIGRLNLAINCAHAVGSIAYMLVRGHYFKHDATRGDGAAKKGLVRGPGARLAEKIALAVEEHNYWNPFSILWNVNTVFVPFIKMSYVLAYGLASPARAGTKFVDACVAAGLLVTAAYTVVVWF